MKRTWTHFPRLTAAAEKLGPNALAVLEEIADRLARDSSPQQEESIERRVYDMTVYVPLRAWCPRAIDGGNQRSKTLRSAPTLRVIRNSLPNS